MFRPLALTLTLSTVALPALADPVDTRTARSLLFRADRVEVAQVNVAGLSAPEVTVLTQLAMAQQYYAAVAIEPEAGLMAETTVMAANHHTPDAARTVALDLCNERRGRSGRACLIVLEVRPQGWEARDLMLSTDATTAFNDDYRRTGGARAFATSISTGQWGIGRGESAVEGAVTACQGDTDVSDCVVVIAD